MDQHDLGLRCPPHKAAHLASRCNLDLDALHRGRAVVGEAELGRILREKTELVVGDHVSAQ
jgi:hypothetical protein